MSRFDQDLAFVGNGLFGMPVCVDVGGAFDCDVAVLGVPYDQGCSARSGAKAGPDAIRRVKNYDYVTWPSEEAAGGYFNVDERSMRMTGMTMIDCGDIVIRPADPSGMIDRTCRVAREIIANSTLLVALGGDQSVSFPLIQAFDDVGPLEVVHFDAHLDFATPPTPGVVSHGSAMRLVSDLSHVAKIHHAGIRSTPQGFFAESVARGNTVVTARDLEQGPDALVEVLIDGELPVYVSVDIDVLDPSVAPGTGSPEPGGLTYRELRDCLRAVSTNRRVLGLEVVEVSPPYDHAETTALTASQLIVDVLDAVWERAVTPSVRSSTA